MLITAGFKELKNYKQFERKVCTLYTTIILYTFISLLLEIQKQQNSFKRNMRMKK